MRRSFGGVLAFAIVFVLGVACGSRTLDTAGATDASTDGADAMGDFSKCDATTKCILAVPGCCGAICAVPKLSDFVAIDANDESALRTATCPAPQPCPNCAAVPDPNLVAACRASECTGVDLRTDAISACTTDADCRLRWGGDCCECGAASYQLVSIAAANEPELDAILCAPATACTRHCAPTPYPAEKKAVCNPTTLHCEVGP